MHALVLTININHVFFFQVDTQLSGFLMGAGWWFSWHVFINWNMLALPFPLLLCAPSISGAECTFKLVWRAIWYDIGAARTFTCSLSENPSMTIYTSLWQRGEGGRWKWQILCHKICSNTYLAVNNISLREILVWLNHILATSHFKLVWQASNQPHHFRRPCPPSPSPSSFYFFLLYLFSLFHSTSSSLWLPSPHPIPPGNMLILARWILKMRAT